MRRKVLITTGIVIGILAIVVGVIMIIMGKEEKIECPVTGVKLGMSWEEVEKTFEKKGIEWTVVQGTGKYFRVKNIYSDFFESEIQGAFHFSEKNKLEQIDLYTVSNAISEKIVEKITTYYTKKYGKVKKSYEEGTYALYYWETDDWGLRIDYTFEDISIIIGAY